MAECGSAACSSISLKLNDLKFPIHKYAFNGDKRQIKNCIKKGLDINFANISGFTPLYLSALGGHKKSSKYLIKMGADPNRRTFDGLTALHAAAQFGDAELVDMLIAAGGDLRLHDYNLHSVIDYARQNKDVKTRDNIVRLVQKTTQDAVNKPQVDYLETTAIFNKRQKGNKFSFSNIFGKKFEGLGNCTMIADGFGKVLVQRDETCSLFKNYPLVSVNDLDHDDNAHSWENGPHFVMEGMLWNGEPVTIKRLHTRPKKSTCIDLIIEELNNLLKLQSNSILTLMGASRGHFAENEVLVFERITYGSLFDYLHMQKNTLSYDQSAVIMRQISCALRYLHRNRFIHCSVTSHAIFLTDNYHAKLGNFEYMSMFESQHPCQVILNRYLNSAYNWMAPEVMEGLKPTPMSDVYSYTSVFWEATQGCIPWANVPFNLIYDKVANGQWSCLAFEAIDSQNTVMIPDKFLDIISSGMQHNPLSRMSMVKIERILCKYIESNSCCPPTFERPNADILNMLNLSLLDMEVEIPSTSNNALPFPEHPPFAHIKSGMKGYLKNHTGKRRKWELPGDNSLPNKSKNKGSKSNVVKSHSLNSPSAKEILPAVNVAQDMHYDSPKSLLQTTLNEIRIDANSPNTTLKKNEQIAPESAENILILSPGVEGKEPISELCLSDSKSLKSVEKSVAPSAESNLCMENVKKSDLNRIELDEAQSSAEPDISGKERKSVAELFQYQDGQHESTPCEPSSSLSAKKRKLDSFENLEKVASLEIDSRCKAVENHVYQIIRKSSEPEQLKDDSNYKKMISSSAALGEIKLGDEMSKRRSISQSYKIDFLKIEGISTCEEISNHFKRFPKVGMKEKDYTGVEQDTTSFQDKITGASGKTFEAANFLSRKSYFESKLLTPTFSERDLTGRREGHSLFKSSSQVKVGLSCADLPRPFKKRVADVLGRDLKEETECYLNNCKTSGRIESWNFESHFLRAKNFNLSKDVNVEKHHSYPSTSGAKVICQNLEVQGQKENPGISDQEAVELIKSDDKNLSYEEPSKVEDNFFVRESTIQEQNSLDFRYSNFLNYVEDMECSSSDGYEVEEIQSNSKLDLVQQKQNERLVGTNVNKVKESFEISTCRQSNKSINTNSDIGKCVERSFYRGIQQFSFNGRRLVPSRSLNRQCQLPAIGVKPASHLINAKVLKSLDLSFSSDRHAINEAEISLNTPIAEIIRNYEDKINDSFKQLNIHKRGTLSEKDVMSPNISLVGSNVSQNEARKRSLNFPTNPEYVKHGDHSINGRVEPKSDMVHISGLKIYVGGGGDRGDSITSNKKLFNLHESLFDGQWHIDDDDDDVREFV